MKKIIGISSMLIVLVTISVFYYFGDTRQNIPYDIENPDFETGDLSGWEIVEGNAFQDENVTEQNTYWDEDILFEHEGNYHVWGFSGEDEETNPDDRTGSMKSSHFLLSGTGEINFLISGGEDERHLYVALVQAEDEKVLMKATGHQSETYRRVVWDASDYIGEEVYIKVVDQTTGDFGHLNVDDFRVHVKEGESKKTADMELDKKEELERGSFRPQYHFTADENWLNDPNGMVYYEGEYHLFYQHNPEDNVWGPMHWGHAISEDLVHWEHQDIALYPDENGTIFSGSAVVDEHDTSGLFNGETGLVAIFTYDDEGYQTQGIAYSHDNGRTWEKYEGNPVLDMPEEVDDFRDPNVFWYEDHETWVMALAVGQHVYFYQSHNLIDWVFTGEFGGEGALDGVWECPELFEMSVDGNVDETKWVLQVSVIDGGPAGGSGMQYFIGNFNGETFVNENAEDHVLWTDYGADYYAAVSWSDVPDGRQVWLGWMNNWQYAEATPTDTWRGAMSLPRDLSLTRTEDGLRVVQEPAKELKALQGEGQHWSNEIVSEGTDLLQNVQGDTVEIIAEFEVNDQTTATEFGLEVHKGGHEQTTVGYDVHHAHLFVDRSESGETNLHHLFGDRQHAPMSPMNETVKIHIFVDRSSVEVFGNNGTTVFTNQVFPTENHSDIDIYVQGGDVTLKSLHIYPLDAASFTSFPEGP
ncbi:GH32 C-terminal domain-containing protein [Salipaludibacillus agaradhaerens]|uniref:GH32 C-terminal domain-containing protein n=1 Tax=Salipaludibacillus agaradhaerens TaxID=76935 RepID=A0A9Q4B3V8_SALAG|nr:glycoside hydrolase family 32 protein [Salipaludibacillus agaradhaerens]MCR6097527.1 GH32 C-terminal domain-containing protein [Salipaludibacillus agaradhaerens]MCR6112989.1 GH32 C-terminal domain-containing protein [Salipaludibacillus agaradhaerens]